MNIPLTEMQLEELYNDLDIIDMELQTATWDDRYNKLKLKKSILEWIRKLENKLDLSNNN